MADELLEIGGRTYKVVRHFRQRAKPTGRFKTVYVADRTGKKHRMRVPETEQKLVQVGVQHIRVGEKKKLGRRKRLRLQAQEQSNG